jgi:hypothetical protein
MALLVTQIVALSDSANVVALFVRKAGETRNRTVYIFQSWGVEEGGGEGKGFVGEKVKDMLERRGRRERTRRRDGGE